MKIAIVRSEAFKMSETFIYNQFKALQHQEKMLIFQRDCDHNGQWNNDFANIELRRYNKSKLLKLGIRIFGFSRFLINRSLLNVLQNNQITVLLIHFGTEACRMKHEIKISRLPCFVMLHGYDVSIKASWWKSLGFFHPLRYYHTQLLELSALENVNFIAVSKRVADAAKKIGIPSSKISIRPIGTDIEKFHSTGQKRRIVLFVGRLVEKKSIATFMNVVGELCRKNADLDYVVIGDGEQRDILKTHEYFNAVTWLGECSHERVKQQMRDAKYFILPSKTAENGDTEGLPISLIEAMSSSCISFLGVDDGYIEPIENGHNGFIIEDDNHVKAAAKILELELDLHQSNYIAQRARSTIVEKYNIEECSTQVRDLIIGGK